MDTSVWKAIFKIGKWAGAIFGLGNFLVWTRELLTRADRDVLIEMLGSVVSLHSLYLGASATGLLLALACSFPTVRWMSEIRKRHAHKKQANSPSGKFRRLHEIILNEFHLTEADIQNPGLDRSPALKFYQRKILKFELSESGIATPNPVDNDNDIWQHFLANLVPLSHHGRIEEAITLWTALEQKHKKTDG